MANPGKPVSAAGRAAENTRGAGVMQSLPTPGRVRKIETNLIIALGGKAAQVFRLFRLYCERQGNKTLEELAKGG